MSKPCVVRSGRQQAQGPGDGSVVESLLGLWLEADIKHCWLVEACRCRCGVVGGALMLGWLR